MCTISQEIVAWSHLGQQTASLNVCQSAQGTHLLYRAGKRQIANTNVRVTASLTKHFYPGYQWQHDLCD
jgi:hypothetical protein